MSEEEYDDWMADIASSMKDLKKSEKRRRKALERMAKAARDTSKYPAWWIITSGARWSLEDLDMANKDVDFHVALVKKVITWYQETDSNE